MDTNSKPETQKTNGGRDLGQISHERLAPVGRIPLHLVVAELRERLDTPWAYPWQYSMAVSRPQLDLF